MTKLETKRIFFGFEVFAPWPEELPEGRVLESQNRHLTVAFLGSVELEKIQELTDTLPKPAFPMAPSGMFNQCLFLPKGRENVVAWNIKFISGEEEFIAYEKTLSDFLLEKKWIRKADFLPHVTLSRKPFDREKWEQEFEPLPCYLKNFHLYESVGNLEYRPIWSLVIPPPLEEILHTADRGFILYGKNIQDLFLHAQVSAKQV